MSDSINPADISLTTKEAFLVMTEYVWRFGHRCDDLFTLIGDTFIDVDGEPVDPAAWDDWLECVAHVKAGKALRNQSFLPRR